MPTLAGIDVHVVTGQDQHKAPEHGVQYIRGKTQVSAYIESQTGQPFKVSVQPSYPFYSYEKESTHTYGTRIPAAGRFGLLASIYIDGRSKPEMRRVIYLDPKHQDFTPLAVSLKGRVATDANGNPIRLAWVFEDAWGLETVFGRMAVDRGTVRGGDDTRSKMGLIRVVLERVKPIGVVAGFQPNPMDTEGRDASMGEVDREITHTTGYRNLSLDVTELMVD